MNLYKEARDRGGAYLLKRLRADGSFGDPEKGATEYYKVPAALLVCGESGAAARLCDWIRKNGMTPDGDFGPRPAQARDSYYYAYHNIWIVLAAQRLGQFDLAHRGMGFLMGFRDPESEGFYSSYTGREADTEQDLWVVSGCGIAALYTGQIEAARGVGRWMERLMRSQPNFPRQMYTVYNRTDGLLTPKDPEDEFRYVLNADAERDQSFFHPGIAGGFLARLFQATGEEKWLSLAKEYMVLAEGATDYLWRTLRAGKVGWCASVLYTLTGERKYRDMAVRVGDNLVATQTEEGYWSMVGSDGPSNDATAEMVVWLDEIYQAVGTE